ncbi:TPA: tight adherence pilus pseudopilin TadF [Enterobacter hormaechei]
MMSIYKIVKFLKLIKRSEGAVAIEFSISFMLLVALCMMMIDYGSHFLEQSYANRVNLLLANALRERTSLYNGRMMPDAADVNQLEKISQNIFGSKYIINKDYFIDVRAVSFVPGNKNKVLEPSLHFASSGINPCDNDVNARSINLPSLSAWDPAKGWTPVYQVALCMPGSDSLFYRFISGIYSKAPRIFVASAVIPR